VLGDTVNLSARLMQAACPTGGILVDRDIVNAASPGLHFQALDSIAVKGKSNMIEIFRPYPDSASPAPHFFVFSWPTRRDRRRLSRQRCLLLTLLIAHLVSLVAPVVVAAQTWLSPRA